MDLDLEYVFVDMSPKGELIQQPQAHRRWVIVDQDCDLAWKATTGSAYLVELKPVLTANPPAEWGIRSVRFKLTDDSYLHWDVPSLRVRPEVVLIRASKVAPQLEANHVVRLKTWLGLRYDRPAVPEPYVVLASHLAKAFGGRKHRAAGQAVRDILVRFDVALNGTTTFELVAVLSADTSDDLRDETQTWLAEVALDVPATLAVPSSFEVRGDDEISLAFIENSYSLDLSTVSWPRNEAGPVGAI